MPSPAGERRAAEALHSLPPRQQLAAIGGSIAWLLLDAGLTEAEAEPMLAEVSSVLDQSVQSLMERDLGHLAGLLLLVMASAFRAGELMELTQRLPRSPWPGTER
jgi:hypothetical protein